MKKKIKDLTLEVIENICKINDYCKDCPLYRFNDKCLKNSLDFYDFEEIKDIEVEVIENDTI